MSTAQIHRCDELYHLKIIARPSPLACRVGGRRFLANRLFERFAMAPEDLGPAAFELRDYPPIMRKRGRRGADRFDVAVAQCRGEISLSGLHRLQRL